MTVSSGIILSIAGSGATGASSVTFSGDNGQATAAEMSYPLGLAVDSSGTSLLHTFSSNI